MQNELFTPKILPFTPFFDNFLIPWLKWQLLLRKRKNNAINIFWNKRFTNLKPFSLYYYVRMVYDVQQMFKTAY